METVKRCIAAWDRFWFESDGRAQIRLFRIGFGLLMFSSYLMRSLDLELYFGANGLMPMEALLELVPQDYRFSLLVWFPGTYALWVFNALLLTSLMSLALGVFPRLSAIVALALHVSFVQRNLAVLYGADIIATFFLMFLCLADYRSDRKAKAGDLESMLGSIAWRLCQIQVCIIYGYSGLKKFKGIAWWSGEAVWMSMAQVQLARWDFSWLSHFPLMMTLLTFTTVLWEAYFPVLVWVKPVRKPLLIIGIFLHLGIAVAINLPIFGALMGLSYCFFLDREAAQQAFVRLGQIINRMKLAKVQTANAE